ncbi:GIY-YIG nuclease family protein [Hydrogenophaga sp. 5NK40-0174]|uniref:GIY-YIG nuclease family protein n=1 Tax=Hydrogenophaga sp. 5NK40-0174 TaxID=3127649 RepID=UPI0031094C27
MDKVDRKARVQAYKLAFPEMGIYAVRNLQSGRQLIGMSTNLPGSLNRHRTELRFGSHRNPALMSDWKAMGESRFAFEVLEQLKEQADPGFNYRAELERRLEAWQQRMPSGSDASYL